MRGTGYAIAEIILWMLSAAVVGGLLGWILRGYRRESLASTQWESLAKAERSQNNTLRERIAVDSAAIADLESSLGAASTRVEQLIEEASNSTGDEDRRARDLDAANARIVLLEARLGEGIETRSEPDDATAPDSRETPGQAVATSIVAEIALRTRGDGPSVEDDLKRIHGVGPKLETLLKGMGITSFAQVARFTPDDIAHVTVALEAFPGRIERDNWPSSAASEHLAKYGENPVP